jgi:hypothetical protein
VNKEKVLLKHLIVVPLTFFLLVLYTQTVSNDFDQYELIYNIVRGDPDWWGGDSKWGKDTILPGGGINITTLIIQTRYEPGFIALYYYLSNFFSSSHLFYFIAFSSLLIKYTIFTKYLRSPVIAWFFYIVLFLPWAEANQLRSSVAATFIVYIICRLQDNRKFFLKTFFSMSLHYVGALTYILKYVKKPFLGISIVAIATIFFNTLIIFVNSKLAINAQLGFGGDPLVEAGVNVFSSIAIMQLNISIFCFYKWTRLNEQQKKGAFLIILGLIIYYLMANNPGVAHRIRELSLLGIFPLIFSIDKIKVNFPSLLLFISIAYLVIYHFFVNIIELISYF